MFQYRLAEVTRRCDCSPVLSPLKTWGAALPMPSLGPPSHDLYILNSCLVPMSLSLNLVCSQYPEDFRMSYTCAFLLLMIHLLPSSDSDAWTVVWSVLTNEVEQNRLQHVIGIVLCGLKSSVAASAW